MRTQIQILALAFLSPAALVGCGNPADLGATDDTAALAQQEAFNSNTNPASLVSLLGTGTSLNADALVPTTSIGTTVSVPTASRPFSGTYWPMTQDGINNRWQGSS